MSAKTGAAKRRKAPPQTLIAGGVPAAFVNNQVREEGRSQRPVKENVAVRSLREQNEKNLEKANKARQTRQHRQETAALHTTSNNFPVTPRSHPTNVGSNPSSVVLSAPSASHPPFLPATSRNTYHAALGTVPHQQQALFTPSPLGSTVIEHRSSLLEELNSPALGDFDFAAIQSPTATAVTTAQTGHDNLRDFGQIGNAWQNTRNLNFTPATGGNVYEPQHGSQTPQNAVFDRNTTVLQVPSGTPRQNLVQEDDEAEEYTYDKEAWKSPEFDNGDGNESEGLEVIDTSQLNAEYDGAGGERGLQATTRSVNLKRKGKGTHLSAKKAKTTHHNLNVPATAPSDDIGAEDELSNAEEEEEDDIQESRKRPSRSIRGASDDEQLVVTAAYEIFRSHLSKTDPWPDRERSNGSDNAIVDRVKAIAITSWFEAARALDIAVNPTDFLLKRIKDRCSQFRGNLRDKAAELVVAAYGFIDISSLPNPTRAVKQQTFNQNRELVKKLKSTFWYTNPDDLDAPDSMYRNPIIQQVFNRNWFASRGIFARSKYFKTDTEVPLETIALILAAIQCAIDEWKSGKFQRVEFEGRHYQKPYKKFLTGLEKWKEFCIEQDDDQATRLQEDLLQNARSVVADSSEDEDVDEDAAALLERFTRNQRH